MNRIWVVSEQYAPEQNTTAYYLTKIAEGLGEHCRAAVLCGQPNYLSRGLKAPRFEKLEGVEVRRCAGTRLDKNKFYSKLINMLTLGCSVFVNAIFRFRRDDKVMVVTSPPLMPFLVAVAALVRRTPLTLLVFDRYPQNLVAAGLTKPDGILVRLLNLCNAWLYSRAESIVAVGRDMADAIEVQVGSSAEKVRTIQNWAMLEDVFPVPKEHCALVRELGLEAKFVVLYAGNMGPPQDIESVVGAAELLDSPEFEQIHFLFIGTGRKRPWLEREIGRLGLSNVTLLAPRPLSNQNSFLNACDIALVPLVMGMKTAAMPSRTYNFMAAGKPVIAITEDGSELALVVQEDRIGWVVPPDQPDTLKTAILDAYRSRSCLGEMSENAFETARTKYSFDAAISKYLELFSLRAPAPSTIPQSRTLEAKNG